MSSVTEKRMTNSIEAVGKAPVLFTMMGADMGGLDSLEAAFKPDTDGCRMETPTSGMLRISYTSKGQPGQTVMQALEWQESIGGDCRFVRVPSPFTFTFGSDARFFDSSLQVSRVDLDAHVTCSPACEKILWNGPIHVSFKKEKVTKVNGVLTPSDSSCVEPGMVRSRSDDDPNCNCKRWLLYKPGAAFTNLQKHGFQCGKNPFRDLSQLPGAGLMQEGGGFNYASAVVTFKQLRTATGFFANVWDTQLETTFVLLPQDVDDEQGMNLSIEPTVTIVSSRPSVTALDSVAKWVTIVHSMLALVYFLFPSSVKVPMYFKYGSMAKQQHERLIAVLIERPTSEQCLELEASPSRP